MVFVAVATMFPTNSYAYLLPLIGGLGWALAIIFGIAAFLFTYIWVNVKKFRKHFKRKPENDAEQDSKKDS